MEDNKPKREWDPVPYFMHEEILTRQEINTRRFFIAWLITFIALVVTNVGWIWYESQFEEVVMTQEASTDGGGNATINGSATGDINYYGESETDYQDQTEEGEQE